MEERRKKNAEKVMTVQEVSAYLKIPISTLYDLTRKGKLRGVKVGRQWRYLERDIVNFLNGIPNSSVNPHAHDRRQSSRIRTNIHGNLMNVFMETPSSSKEGVLRNLSKGGALFEDHNGGDSPGKDPGLEVGDPVKLTFEIPGNGPALTIEGWIVHQSANSPLRLGIKFRKIPEDKQRILREYAE